MSRACHRNCDPDWETALRKMLPHTRSCFLEFAPATHGDVLLLVPHPSHIQVEGQLHLHDSFRFQKVTEHIKYPDMRK